MDLAKLNGGDLKVCLSLQELGDGVPPLRVGGKL